MFAFCLHSWRIVSLVVDFWVNSFFLFQHKDALKILLPSIISYVKFLMTGSLIFLYNLWFFSWCFIFYSLSLALSNLTVLYLCVILFVFIWFGVCWAPQSYKFLSLIKSGKFGAIISSGNICPLLFSLSGIKIAYMLCCLIFIWECMKLCWFF